MLELPQHGDLLYHGNIVSGPGQSLGSADAEFTYRSRWCDSRVDEFVVQLSSNVVVLVTVEGCNTEGPLGTILAILIPLVAVLIIGIVVMYIFLKPKTRDNRNAPKDPTRPICVLFTDIQACVLRGGREQDGLRGFPCGFRYCFHGQGFPFF